MNHTIHEGIVENGQIRLMPDIRLPEKTKVYVLVPAQQTNLVAHIYSPRLANPNDADAFVMEVVQESADALL